MLTLAGVCAVTAWLWLADPPGARGAASGRVGTASEHFRPTTHFSEALLPLPPAPEEPPDKVALGRRLFHDRQLSHDDSIACASCHDLARGGGTDRRVRALGIGGKLGPINTPTVFNAALNLAQFWDGRASTLEEQAAGPVHNVLEMGSNWDEVCAKLARDAGYVQAFQRVYGQPPSGAAIADALASFERTLRTPGSRLDHYLLGESTALTLRERAGYQYFIDFGCAGCHQGAGIGGNMFQRFGVMDDYFRDRPNTPADLGRYNVTGRPEDLHVFKVPGLRNVAQTAPYFHDGSAATLEEAVLSMGRYQLGRRLSPDEVAALVAFLRSLTGQWQGQPLP